ncbi:MAG TPA: FtsX-like permease family protein [Rhodanobacteraceae bacterium]
MWYLVKPLLRRPLLPLLIVLQVAVACAIATNALFLLQQKLAPILMPSGIASPGRLVVLRGIAARGAPWPAARLRTVEADLRAVPGVSAVTYAASFPVASHMIIKAPVQAVGGRTTQKTTALIYLGDHLLPTMGLRLVAGRDFTPEEDVTIGTAMGFGRSGPVIISRALARRLFPDGHAIGRQIGYGHGDPHTRTVVGVVADLAQNYFGQRSSDLAYAMLFPGVADKWHAPVFAARLRAAAEGPVCRSLLAVVQRDLGARQLPGQAVHCDTLAALRHRALAAPRAAVWLLAGVTAVVLIVTLTGVMGLTGYWIQQRTKEIGIRRALGATRGAILRQVQCENLIVVAAGVVLGLLAAVGVNLWLMRHYELLRLPWPYLPIGAALLLVLGQLAVLKPALHAARVPPVVATRSV